ncbi:hypothetical protein BDSB_13695 [Burkholderia dolosa PC543]|nr:hypothetical protein BDSB_13695 [Burkholderia dolosa PC543]
MVADFAARPHVCAAVGRAGLDRRSIAVYGVACAAAGRDRQSPSASITRAE